MTGPLGEDDDGRSALLALIRAIVAGGATFATAPLGPAAAPAAAGAVELGNYVIDHVRQWRAGRAAHLLETAAGAGNVPLGNFVNRAVAEGERLALLASAMEAAMRTANEEKVAALGRALATGVLADDVALIDERGCPGSRRT